MNLILSENRGLKFTNFFALYFLQGWIAGFTGTALVNEFAARGTPVGVLGEFAFIIGLPWIIQFIWSPLVDRFPNFSMGKRRTWLIGALIPANFVLLFLFFVPFGPLPLAIVFLLNAILCSIMDVAVDGMTLDLVPESETGLSSALTNGGSVLGGCISALIFSWTLSKWTFSSNVILLISVSAIITCLPVFTRERRDDRFFSLRSDGPAIRKRLPFRKLLSVFVRRLSRPKALFVLITCFAMNFAFGVIALTFNAELLQSGGWSAFQLSRTQSLLGFASGTVGALAVGKLCDRFGFRKILGTGLAAMVAFFLLMAFAPHSTPFVYLIVLTVTPGLLFVSLVPGVMEVSRGAVAATLFTLCMTTMNFGSIAGAGVSDFLFQHVSRFEVFVTASGLFGLSVLALVTLGTATKRTVRKPKIRENARTQKWVVSPA